MIGVQTSEAGGMSRDGGPWYRSSFAGCQFPMAQTRGVGHLTSACSRRSTFVTMVAEATSVTKVPAAEARDVRQPCRCIERRS